MNLPMQLPTDLAETRSRSGLARLLGRLGAFEVFIALHIAVTVFLLRAHNMNLGWQAVAYSVPKLLVSTLEILAYGVLAYIVWCLARRRPLRPYFRRIRTAGWLFLTLRIYIGIVAGAFGYMWLKVSIPLINERLWDRQLWNLDVWLHGGISPSLFLTELFQGTILVTLVDWWYASWLWTSLIGMTFFCCFPQARIRRQVIYSHLLAVDRGRLVLPRDSRAGSGLRPTGRLHRGAQGASDQRRLAGQPLGQLPEGARRARRSPAPAQSGSRNRFDAEPPRRRTLAADALGAATRPPAVHAVRARDGGNLRRVGRDGLALRGGRLRRNCPGSARLLGRAPRAAGEFLRLDSHYPAPKFRWGERPVSKHRSRRKMAQERTTTSLLPAMAVIAVVTLLVGMPLWADGYSFNPLWGPIHAVRRFRWAILAALAIRWLLHARATGSWRLPPPRRLLPSAGSLLLSIVTIGMLMPTYSHGKLFIPYFNSQLWDAPLYELERAVHFGFDPNPFVLALVEAVPLGAQLIDVTYMSYATLVGFSVAWFITEPRLDARHRFVRGFTMIWLGGLAGYLLLPAHGPIYVFPRSRSRRRPAVSAQLRSADGATQELRERAGRYRRTEPAGRDGFRHRRASEPSRCRSGVHPRPLLSATGTGFASSTSR